MAVEKTSYASRQALILIFIRQRYKRRVLSISTEMEVQLWHPDTGGEKDIIDVPECSAKGVAYAAAAGARSRVCLAEDEGDGCGVCGCDLRDVLGEICPEDVVVGEEVQAEAVPALCVACGLGIQVHCITRDLVFFDKTCASKVYDVKVINLVLLVRKPRRVREDSGLKLRRSSGVEIPVCGHDLIAQITPLLDVFSDVPAGYAPVFIDVMVDLIAEFEKLEFRTEDSDRCFCFFNSVGPSTGIVFEVKGVEEVCACGEVIAPLLEPGVADVEGVCDCCVWQGYR